MPLSNPLPRAPTLAVATLLSGMAGCAPAVESAPPPQPKVVVAGEFATWVSMSDGSVAACGNFVGDGTEGDHPQPRTVDGLDGFAHIVTGEASACMLRDGDVSCWGENDVGQLGNGMAGSKPALEPVRVASLAPSEAVACSLSACVALDSNGDVYWWGANDGFGGSPEMSDKPVQFSAVHGAHSVAFGDGTGCIIGAQGALTCWGRNVGYGGKLGSYPTKPSLPPTQINPGGPVKDVVVGDDTICALTTAGVVCFGFDPDAIPNGSSLPGLEGTVQLVGGGDHYCALADGGQVTCWGTNQFGELGRGHTSPETTVLPPGVVNGITAHAISAAKFRTCALLADGDVACWGSGAGGQLCNRSDEAATKPERIQF